MVAATLPSLYLQVKESSINDVTQKERNLESVEVRYPENKVIYNFLNRRTTTE